MAEENDRVPDGQCDTIAVNSQADDPHSLEDLEQLMKQFIKSLAPEINNIVDILGKVPVSLHGIPISKEVLLDAYLKDKGDLHEEEEMNTKQGDGIQLASALVQLCHTHNEKATSEEEATVYSGVLKVLTDLGMNYAADCLRRIAKIWHSQEKQRGSSEASPSQAPLSDKSSPGGESLCCHPTEGSQPVQKRVRIEIQPKSLSDLPDKVLEKILVDVITDVVKRQRVDHRKWANQFVQHIRSLSQVCPQWRMVLQSDSFTLLVQNVLKLAASTPRRLRLELDILNSTELISSTIAVAYLNGKLIALCHEKYGHPKLYIYEDNLGRHLQCKLDLEEVEKPKNLSVCSLTNTIYVLHQSGNCNCILKLRYENGALVDKSAILQGSHHESVSVTPDGKLILLYREYPKYLLVSSDDGRFEFKLYLPDGVALVSDIIGKGNGDYVLVCNEDVRRFTEIDESGNKLQNVASKCVCQLNYIVDAFDRLVMLKANGTVEVYDNAFTCIQVTNLQGNGAWLDSARLTYDREKNLLIIYDSHKPSSQTEQRLFIAELKEIFERI